MELPSLPSLAFKSLFDNKWYTLLKFTCSYIKGTRPTVMRKWVSIFLALLVLAVSFLGCAGIQKDAQVKCPKCGAIFTIDESLEKFD